MPRLLLVLAAAIALLTAGDTRAAPCGLNDTGDAWGYSDPETGAWLPCAVVSPTPPVVTPTPTPGPVAPVRWLPVVSKGEAPTPPVWQLWAPVVWG